MLGDIVVGQGVDRTRFIQQAADDMDAKLGWIYELPLRRQGQTIDPQAPVIDPTDDWKNLPTHQVLLLKGINNKLASGRLILTLDIAGEGSTLHAYGWQLVREANAELAVLSNGEVFLAAARITDDQAEHDDSRIPGISQPDSESLVLGFENTVMRGVPWYSRPGEVPVGPLWR